LEFTIFGHSFRLLVGLDSFGLKVKPALIGLITVVDAVDIADAKLLGRCSDPSQGVFSLVGCIEVDALGRIPAGREVALQSGYAQGRCPRTGEP